MSYFQKVYYIPLQKLVFLKFYSLIEETVRSDIYVDIYKINFILLIFIYFDNINKSLRIIKAIFATFEKMQTLTIQRFNS